MTCWRQQFFSIRWSAGKSAARASISGCKQRVTISQALSGASQAESQFKIRARFLPVLHCRKQSRRPFEDEDLSSSGRSSYICMDASCRNRERSLRKQLRTENSVKKGSAEISDCGFRLQPVGDHSLLRPRRVAAPCAPRTIGPNPARRIVDRGSVRLFVSRCQLTPSPGALRQNKETSTFLCES